MKWARRITKFLLIFALLFAVYVIYVNRNSKQMTLRQKILKAVYPVWMWFSRTSGKTPVLASNDNREAVVSFYSLIDTLNTGTAFHFDQLKGKKVLLVNTASDCGYTNQYEDLQKLHERYGDKLAILGFPANDFKEQEKGNDEEIAQFCKINYGVTFPLMKKSVVIKGSDQNKVYQWLTDPSKNGWNDKPPAWNFSKYLVDEKGRLLHYFSPAVSPLDKEILLAIEK